MRGCEVERREEKGFMHLSALDGQSDGHLHLGMQRAEAGGSDPA